MDMVPRSGGVVREYKKEQHLCHCEPSQMAWQSLFCCCVARALMRPVRILVFVQTALALVFTYSDSSRGSIATVAIQWIIKSHAFACVHYLLDCFATLAMTKRKPRNGTKHPYMIFLLQDILQTNRINTKHMPKINHRLNSAIFIYKNPKFPRIFNLVLCRI